MVARDDAVCSRAHTKRNLIVAMTYRIILVAYGASADEQRRALQPLFETPACATGIGSCVIVRATGGAHSPYDTDPRVRVIEVAPNMIRTLGENRNRGAQGATEDVLLFIDGDIEVSPQFVADGLVYLSAHTDVASVTGRIKEIQTDATGVVVRMLPDLHQVGGGGAVVCMSALWMTRLDAWQQSGGFDASLPAEEDIEWCLRLQQKGWKLIGLPLLAGTHTCHVRPSLFEIGRRWCNGMYAGPGLVLRRAWGTPSFVPLFVRQKIYMAMGLFLTLGVCYVLCSVFTGSVYAIIWWLLCLVVLFCLMSIKKKSIRFGTLSVYLVRAGDWFGSSGIVWWLGSTS